MADTDLVTTTCIGCGQRDDHPKHVLLVNADHTTVNWHMDCHSRSGDGCEVCTSQIAGKPAGTIGAELREHLTSKDS